VLEVIAQSVAVIAEQCSAESTPPRSAELEVIVHPVTVTVETPTAWTAPPMKEATFEDIVQFVALTVDVFV
jgi:hypothetical protein